MKPASFEYFAPESVESALELVARYGEGQKILAGGQSLVPLMNMRLARVDQLIDLNRINALRYVRETTRNLTIGAMTTQRSLERSEDVRCGWPLLAEAISYIGHFQIRNRGTVGGSIAHADPSGELPLMLLVHGGFVLARSARGTRQIAADDLFVSFLTTSLEADEVITEVVVPRPPASNGWSFHEVARRHGDFAMVAVAVLLELDGERIIEARIAVAGGADRPLRARRAEAALIGNQMADQSFAEAARLVSEEVRPSGDVHASADYRREVSRVLTRRALLQAQQRASGAR